MNGSVEEGFIQEAMSEALEGYKHRTAPHRTALVRGADTLSSEQLGARIHAAGRFLRARRRGDRRIGPQPPWARRGRSPGCAVGDRPSGAPRIWERVRQRVGACST
jgi:hypothetical protein